MVYGSDQGESIEGYHFKDPGPLWNDDIADHRQLAAYVGNGVVYVMGAGADTVTGTSEGDIAHGGGGADVLNGQGGADTFTGGHRADVMFAGAGNDAAWRLVA